MKVIDWMKYRFVYMAISASIIVPGLFSLLRYGLKLSIDFTGGSVVKFDNISKNTFQSVSDFQFETIAQTDSSLTLKTKTISQDRLDQITEQLKTENPDIRVDSFETVGPALGKETIIKTLTAVVIASLLLLVHITRAFKDFRFGVSAILAMFHDSLVLLGSFSLLGHFFNVETDLLFVTAVLTVLSFSVHDTIVVYDRIRELVKKKSNFPIHTLANIAVSETMVRSLVNSLTIIFMLMALVLIGGASTKNFALALLIGSISGAYSSPFTAVPILVVWDELSKRR